MFHFFGLGLRFICATTGVLLIYASLSYETEDGKIQNLIEEWWVRIDDFRRQAISFHIAFMRVLASVMTTFLDRLFGVRVLSLQSLGVSMCYSIVWIGIGFLILSRLNANSQSAMSHDVWFIVFGIGYGTIPAFIPKNAWTLSGITWVQLWFWSLLLIVFWNFFDPLGYLILYGLTKPEFRMGVVIPVAAIVGVIFAMFLFTAFVGIMRVAMRTIARSESSIKIVGLSMLNATPIVTFYGLFKLAVLSPDYSGRFATVILITTVGAVFCGILFNFAFVLSAVLFVCLATLMFLHRLFWPAIQRPLYKLQALGIAERPKFFAAIGLILLGAAFGKHEWLFFIVDKLTAH